MLLLIALCILVFPAVASTEPFAGFIVWPVDPIVEGSQFTVNVQVNGSEKYPAWLRVTSAKGLAIAINDTIALTDANFSFSLTTTGFGHETLYFFSGDDPQSINISRISDATLAIRILRRETIWDTVFIVFISIFILINNINMGCLLDVDVLKSVFRKPIGPIVGFCSQFLFMPLASYGIAMALLDSDNSRLGLFTLGCCPGGTGSNFWTILFYGDVDLSVVMTFVSTVAALGMMPLWIFTLGNQFFQGGNLKVPYVNLLTSLITFTIPIAIGMIIRRFRPKWAEYAKKIIRPYTIVILVFFLTIGIYVNLFLFLLMTWQMVLAGAAVAWGGYVFGALAAKLFCLNRNQIVAISIETALQNPGIAFVLLKISLPQPDADLAAVAPVAQLFVTGVPLWFFYIAFLIHRRMNKKKEENVTRTPTTDKVKSKPLLGWFNREKTDRTTVGNKLCVNEPIQDKEEIKLQCKSRQTQVDQL